MRKKSGLFMLILMITCIVLSVQAGEKAVDVKIIPDQKIAMRDGVKLSARIWMPEEMANESQRRGMFFAQNGYVYTRVDVRGRGHSAGIFFPLEGDKHSKDIYDIVNWIAKQSWSDGQVAMRGGSYRGMVQWQAMKTRPPALKTLVSTDALSPGRPIYHSPRLEKDLEVAGFIAFNAYISLDVPDTDLQVTLYEIKPNGISVFLTQTVMRVR
jgi:predicted acyl esterase